jgi:hypothetical protein
MTLTPYDTGQRHEPQPWSPWDQYAHDFDDDRYGKVDFDDNAGETSCTVWVQGHEDGRDVVHVYLHRDLDIEVHAPDADPNITLDSRPMVGREEES